MNLKTVVYLVLLTISTALCAQAEEIRVSIQLQPNQREKFEQLFSQFHGETGIRVVSVVENDLDYKAKVPMWLLEGINTPDVMFWSASNRLFEYVEKDTVLPITDLWDEEQFDERFALMKPGVSFHGESYAVPFAYYHWGLFYRSSLIEEFGGIPDDWESFIAQLSKMKTAGITPIGIGTKQNWPAAAWFDYINLRINGLDFHLALLQGHISFNDVRVQNVLSEWKRLIDGDFYNQDHKDHNWDGVLPLFYRNKIGYLLLGNFVASKWPVNHPVYNDIELMPFPTMDASLPFYENAPTDVFLIPKQAKNIEQAKTFLRFIARADVQTRLNEGLGYLPANKNSAVGNDRFIRAGALLIDRAEGLAQFFDRDTDPDFDRLATPLLADFISHGDIELLTRKLEESRMTVFGPLPSN